MIYQAEVIRWVDGDTVEAHTWKEEVTRTESHGVTITVTTLTERTEGYRLVTVDTPERGEPGYREATAYVNALLPPGSPCTIETHGADNGGWGRTLGNVLPAGSRDSISERLLRDGMAAVYKRT